MEIKPGPLLSNIDNPADLKKLSKEQMHQVCDELRQYIIDVVSVHGGHFAASLGVVELSVALHYVYNTPYDQLVWDVGHQAYDIKYSPAAEIIFPPIENIKGLADSPTAAKVNTILLVWGILPLPSVLPLVWPWLQNIKAKKIVNP